jgi:hypothetical protein
MKHGLQRKSNFTWQEKKKTAFEIIINNKKTKNKKHVQSHHKKLAGTRNIEMLGAVHILFLYFKNIF